jgi:acetyl-CoA carboxylase biotin carboxyl carrier protein
MVGTFYRASGPGEKPFVTVGDSVDENTTVCIIEAMKVMNEIKAEKRGVIIKVMVEDATPVQYDSPLFQIQPA